MKIRFPFAIRAVVLPAATAVAAMTPGRAAEVVAAPRVDSPERVEAGTLLPFAWTGPRRSGDYLTIVPEGAPEGEYGRFKFVEAGSPMTLTAPFQTGPHEVRYMSGAAGKTLARAPVLVVPVEAGLSVPDSVMARAEFSVRWLGPRLADDYVEITSPPAAAGAPFRRAQYFVPGEDTVELRAPAEPGGYIVSYVSGPKQTALAREALPVTPSDASVAGPAQAAAGTSIEAAWTGPDAPGDFVAVVAADAGPARFRNFAFTDAGSPASVTVPQTPGPAEIRYVSGAGKAVLAAQPIEIIAPPSIAVSVPEQGEIRQQIEVAWDGPAQMGDYVTVVPAGALPGSYTDFAYLRGAESPAVLRLPDRPGLHEVRYVSGADGSTLATDPIRIFAPESVLVVPSSVPAGAEFSVTWDRPAGSDDFVAIASEDAAPTEFHDFAYVEGDKAPRLFAPLEPGSYSVRYITGRAERIIAAVPITVTAP